MGLLSLTVASDIASMALTYYVRGKMISQTMQDRPLVSFLNQGKRTFPGGKDYISEPVQGAYMADVSGFFAGYTEDDTLAFKQAANALRAQVPWKEVHAGLVISWTELKKDGITVTATGKSDHSEAMQTRLTSILENRLDDYSESWARCFNDMLWKDGTQDSKQVPGVRSLLTDTPTTGTTAGLSRASYSWWQHRVNLALATSPSGQELTKFLRMDLIQLNRYGGKPNKALCGSKFWEALMNEVHEKGTYTVEGFAKDNDIGMTKIKMVGLGTFEYDPTLDTLGLEERCYVFDGRRLKLRPMENEENRIIDPERPYNAFVFLKSMTWTGGLEVTQLNCHAVYGIA